MRHHLGLEREGLLVKGKMKNQGKLVSIEEITPRDKHIGHLWGRHGLVLDRETGCFLLLSLVSQKTFAYPCIYLLSPPTPTTHPPCTPFFAWVDCSSQIRQQSDHCCCGMFSSPHRAQERVRTHLTVSCSDLDLSYQVSPFKWSLPNNFIPLLNPFTWNSPSFLRV